MSSAVRPSAARMSAVRPSAARAGAGYFDNPYALTAGAAAAGLGAYGGIRGAAALYKRYLGEEPMSRMPSVNAGGPNTPFAAGGGSNRKEVLTVGNNSIRLPPSNAPGFVNGNVTQRRVNAPSAAVVEVQQQVNAKTGQTPGMAVAEQIQANTPHPATAEVMDKAQELGQEALGLKTSSGSLTPEQVAAADNAEQTAQSLTIAGGLGGPQGGPQLNQLADAAKEVLRNAASGDPAAAAQSAEVKDAAVQEAAAVTGLTAQQVAELTAYMSGYVPRAGTRPKVDPLPTVFQGHHVVLGGKQVTLTVPRPGDKYASGTQAEVSPATFFGEPQYNTKSGLLKNMAVVGYNQNKGALRRYTYDYDPAKPTTKSTMLVRSSTLGPLQLARAPSNATNRYE